MPYRVLADNFMVTPLLPHMLEESRVCVNRIEVLHAQTCDSLIQYRKGNGDRYENS